MNDANTIIAALGGTGALAALVAAITTYFKTKTAAEERKTSTAAAHKKMAEDMDALRADLAAMKETMRTAVAEAAALRADNAELRAETQLKDRRVAKLVGERDEARVMLKIKCEGSKP